MNWKKSLTLTRLIIFLYLFTFNLSAKESQEVEKATFAGGCFWCTQHDFERLKGVLNTVVGYTGGDTINPTYKEVSHGGTGHVESVSVEFNPKVISYEELLRFYWHNVDPTRNDGQFCDYGKQYRPVIFYHNKEQKKLAETSKQQLIDANKISPIVVDILPAKEFYPAEEYHQHYAKKNPLRYKYYRWSCGRDNRLKEIWNK